MNEMTDIWYEDVYYQDAIKLGSHKGKSRLLSCLCKGLLLHLKAAKCQDVTAQEARQRPTTILNGKLGIVFLQVSTSVSISDALQCDRRRRSISPRIQKQYLPCRWRSWQHGTCGVDHKRC